MTAAYFSCLGRLSYLPSKSFAAIAPRTRYRTCGQRQTDSLASVFSLSSITVCGTAPGVVVINQNTQIARRSRNLVPLSSSSVTGAWRVLQVLHLHVALVALLGHSPTPPSPWSPAAVVAHTRLRGS